MFKRFLVELFAPLKNINWVLLLVSFFVSLILIATILGIAQLMIHYEVIKVIFFTAFFAWAASRVVAYIVFAWRIAKR